MEAGTVWVAQGEGETLETVCHAFTNKGYGVPPAILRQVRRGIPYRTKTNVRFTGFSLTEYDFRRLAVAEARFHA